MSIYRTKKSQFWQFDFVVKGRRFHGSTGTADYEEAKAFEAKERVKAGKAPEISGRYTISQALGTYWSEVCQHQPSARTAHSQAAKLLSVLDGSIDTGSLTNAELRRFVSIRRAEVSAATINRQIQLLGRAIRHMHTTYGAALPSCDFRSVELDEPEERIRELTQDEQARLFQHLRPDLHGLVLVALMTGARIDTIARLKWRHIDQATRRITFRLKGGKSMRFPLSDELASLLDSLPRAPKEDTENAPFVILYRDHSRRGHPLKRLTATGGGIMADFREALAAAEIDDFRFHDLRHTFATRLLRRTGNLKLVSRLLGHANIETTARYAHVLDEDMADALEGFTHGDTGRESRSSSRSPSLRVVK